MTKLTEQIINVEKSYNDMKARYVPESSDQAQKIKSLVRNLSAIDADIKKLEKKKMDTAFMAGRLVSEKLEIINEKEKYNSLKEKLNTYDYYIEACSGRGIPFKLLEKYIPVINLEISKILQDNVGFTVELEANSRNNTIETYIDYGDSKRLIELASGMEKMMASIAIRVALISMSSLPKSDIFIIDEGFGALDPGNISTCNTILEMLKTKFKSIVIISHVDAIKDSVDNLIEIEKRGKDSYVSF